MLVALSMVFVSLVATEQWLGFLHTGTWLTGSCIIREVPLLAPRTQEHVRDARTACYVHILSDVYLCVLFFLVNVCFWCVRVSFRSRAFIPRPCGARPCDSCDQPVQRTRSCVFCLRLFMRICTCLRVRVHVYVHVCVCVRVCFSGLSGLVFLSFSLINTVRAGFAQCRASIMCVPCR